MSIILGINAFHAGASACIVIDGVVQFAIAEERLNRIKHFAGFPKLAIIECLKFTGINLSNINYVAVGRDTNANLDQKIKYAFGNPLKLLNLYKIKSSRKALSDLVDIFKEYYPNSQLNFKQINVEHHLAHTASAFFVSGWDSAAGITIDGSGDFLTCMMSRCSGNEITPVHKIYVPNSLGSSYSTICQFIGFDKYGDEGKVMGLAPFGNDVYSDFFKELITFDNGQIKLNPLYFMPFGSDQGFEINDNGEMISSIQYSNNMISLLGQPRKKNGVITKRDKDLAFGLQKRFEEIYFELLRYLHSIVPMERVVIAGGCALNSVANGKIKENSPFINNFIQPAAGDDGLSLGAALYVSRCILKEQIIKEIPCLYLGAEYTRNQIEDELIKNDLIFHELNTADLLDFAVKELCSGKIIGWFQGRSEWGPRSLGNRSIICHPGVSNMKDILNARIKNRESFRPFAPVVLAERQKDIFINSEPTPYMMHVYEINSEWRKKIPAVVHVDGTGRVQTLSFKDNPLFYNLLLKFEMATGLPVLINTSFNENEPVVERPAEAIDCFKRTDMDTLIIGNFISKKVLTKC